MAELGWGVNLVKINIIASTKSAFFKFRWRGVGRFATRQPLSPLGAPVHFIIQDMMAKTTQTVGD